MFGKWIERVNGHVSNGGLRDRHACVRWFLRGECVRRFLIRADSTNFGMFYQFPWVFWWGST